MSKKGAPPNVRITDFMAMANQIKLLSECFSNEEDKKLTQDDYESMRSLFTPLLFEQVALQYDINKNNFTLNKLRLVMISLAASMTAENMHCFKQFNALVKEFPDEIFKDLAINKEDKAERKDIIMACEGPITTAVYFGSYFQNWSIKNLSQNLSSKGKEKIKVDQDYIDTTCSYIQVTQNAIKTGRPSLSPYVQAEFTINNLGSGAEKIKNDAIVMIPDKDGNLKAYQAHKLLVQEDGTTGYKGLHCIAYSSLDKNEPDLKIVFAGTKDAETGLTNTQRHSPGFRTYQKAEPKLLKAVDQLVSRLSEDANGKEVKFSVLGFSLGGAHAQAFASGLLAARAINDAKKNGNQFVAQEMKWAINDEIPDSNPRKGKMLHKLEQDVQKISNYGSLRNLAKISTIELHTKNAPKTARSRAILANASAAYLANNNIKMNVSHFMSQAGDIVSRVGEEFFGLSKHIRLVAMKWDTEETSWSQKHNKLIVQQNIDQNHPIKVKFLYDSNIPNHQEHLKAELRKTVAKPIKAALALGAEIERAVSSALSIKRTSISKHEPLIESFHAHQSKKKTPPLKPITPDQSKSAHEQPRSPKKPR